MPLSHTYKPNSDLMKAQSNIKEVQEGAATHGLQKQSLIAGFEIASSVQTDGYLVAYFFLAKFSIEDSAIRPVSRILALFV